MAQEINQGVAAQIAEAMRCCALLLEAQPVLDEILSYEEQLNEVCSAQDAGGSSSSEVCGVREIYVRGLASIFVRQALTV